MSAEGAGSDASTIAAERDFYRQLLELGEHDDIEPFVERALALVVTIARARRGYMEVRAEADGSDFCIGHASPPEDAAKFREVISQGVIAEALATGHTIATASALADPRFSERGSVRKHRIEAVLCVPFGRGRAAGVIYLQDREQAGPFSEADQERVQAFARHLEPFVDRLLIRREQALEDPTLALRSKLRADGVVGRSKAMAKALEQVALVAPHKVSVIIEGPTGTGKTQLARVIHDNSPRATGPFVELNCATLPENLVENELFGAVVGAFSGARMHDGKVGAAHGGTLFLDEISELNSGVQAKLLQLLQSGTYYQLGSSTPREADVRVIAATNVDLRAAISERAFREDLYYRLNVIPVRLPPLAERSDDIAILAEYFCARACERNGLPRLSVSMAARSAAETSEWPGNVRQLANAIEAAVLRAAADESTSVQTHHLFPDLAADGPEDSLTYDQHLRRFKRQLIQRTLKDTNWNVAEAARRLDVARSHLNKLIRALSLQRS